VAERIDPAANVYARAFHEAAIDAGKVAEVDRDLRAFTEALAENVHVLRALINPELPSAAKKRIISQMMEGAEPVARNGLLLLVDNRRTSLFHDLQIAYSDLAAVDEKILDVDVVTAVALDDQELSELESRISAALGLKARVRAEVDPDIIGGLVLRARGVLLDASIRRRLHELRRNLVHTPLPVGSQA
jgi:F-type H+-transporting ATPase subunit delta